MKNKFLKILSFIFCLLQSTNIIADELDIKANQVKFNKDNSIFYTLNMRQSDVSSNILNHDIERNYKTISLTKRINLNELF